jgi:hypothetical protein
VTTQIVTLFVLALPVAAIAWAVTHEEVLREPREWCARRSRASSSLPARKFFFLFTCEYCFSHYIAAAVLAITRFQMLYAGWRGYFVALFALVWVANLYMSLFGRLRLDIKEEKVEIEAAEAKVRRAERSIRRA